jgi:DNA (cytosine-5)-methyltransferase 1
MKPSTHTVVDLFSGAGGMSLGFHKHPSFRIIAAADAELGKPSTGRGKLQCNSSYKLNIGVSPCSLDLSEVEPEQIREALGLDTNTGISVLSACPPCTGFSRANPANHLRDDHRNSLVRKSAKFAVELSADIMVMENARELIRGNFSGHYEWLQSYLSDNGYNVHGCSYMLSRFGLPQIRERALIIAAKRSLPLKTLDSLWEDWEVSSSAVSVRRAFESIDPSADGYDVYPRFASKAVEERVAAIPKDGGSWIDLLRRQDKDKLLTDSMKKNVAAKRFGSYPDVYGRMALDKPAPTIKRECSHVGNGRYVHPIEDRLCSVREIAALQGFPNDYRFNASSISNLYRHLGDAVPPLISYQIAHTVSWMLSGKKPSILDVILPGTQLRMTDFSSSSQLALVA